MAPLPGSLRHSPAYAFVGRAGELELVRTLLPRKAGDSGRVALISGEPGAGKTRFARELAARLADDGVAVLYGACDAALRVPYRPFLEALEQLFRNARPGELEELQSAELARLLPNRATLDAGTSAPATESTSDPSAPSDPDTARHRLHVAVAELLTAASRRSPLLLVLEDVHWADASTLLLLRHLVRVSGDARMLLVVTYRDVGEDAIPDLTAALIELRRSEGVARVRLSGLSEEEIGEFAQRNTGIEPAGELARAITELTGGNAFLVTETWRELVQTGSLGQAGGVLRLTRPVESLATPESVRAVVAQRLDRLAGATAAALEIGAVAGSVFELATVRAASSLPERDLLDGIDEAERAGLIGDVPSRGLAYQFSHELVRRSVIERLSASRRAEIHLRVAESLARSDSAGERGGTLTALAHHFAAAAPVGGRERAIEYGRLAARAAADALAFDEAAAQLREVLELGLSSIEQRVDVYLELGAWSHRAGKALDAMDAYRQAAGLARQLGDAALLARAAVGFEEACWRPAIHDGGSVALLREAADALGPEDSELRTRVLGGLARALDLRGEYGDATWARDQSIAMARRRGDRRSLALTLAGAWSGRNTPPSEIEAMLDEALQISRELGDADLATGILGWMVPTYVALQDHDRARMVLGRLLDSAKHQNQPFYLHVAEQYVSALAVCDGELAEAEAAAVRSNEWGRLLIGRDASGTYGIQMFNVRREQGRLAEMAPAARVLVDRAEGAWLPGVAALLAELGMTREAKRELERAVFEQLEQERRTLWVAALAYLTDTATVLEDEPAARRLYAGLAAYSGTSAMVGYLVACFGAADRYLGMLAGVLGEWDLAEQYFEAAAALNRRIGAHTWLAHTLCEHGLMLQRRGRPRDKPAAASLIGNSLQLAREFGLARVIARAGASPAGALRPVAEPATGLSARETDVLRLVAQGLSNREIGRALFISEHTTASHVRSILRKIGCANRTEAAAFAHRQGLVE